MPRSAISSWNSAGKFLGALSLPLLHLIATSHTDAALRKQDDPSWLLRGSGRTVNAIGRSQRRTE